MKIRRKHYIDLENDLNNISVLENPIDPSVQKEYYELSNSIDFDNVDYGEVLNKADKLFIRNTPIEAKKKILMLLVHLGTMESSKILEKYLKISEGSLNDWALLSLKECRMFFESVLLKEEGGLISTGLGGKDNKLRYYFIVSTKEGRPLTEAGRNTLKEGFERSSDKYRSEIEGIDFQTNYAMIGILVPMDAAVGEVIEEGIRRYNRMSEVLSINYYVTNVETPAKLEILKYLREIRREEKCGGLMGKVGSILKSEMIRLDKREMGYYRQ